MKVLLVMPAVSEHVFRPGHPPPLPLLSLAAVLREAGHEAVIIDLNLLKSPETSNHSEFCVRHVIDAMEDINPDIVGINCFTAARFPYLSRLADAIKQQNPDLPIIIGGMHPTLFHREILEQCLSIDAIVIGEGERQIVALAEAYGSFQNIDALAYRNRDGQVILNPRKGYIQDLDSLPILAWDLVHFEDYYADHSMWHNPRGLKINMSVPIYTSRSCPFDCNFCSSHNLMGRGLRLRSPILVVDEMEMLYRTYGQNYFGFIDDNLVVNKKHVLSICNEIVRRGMNIQFESSVGFHINSLDEEIIDAMVRAGCTYFILPIEHGNEQIRNKIIGKKLAREKIFEVVDICKRYNVLTGTSCIMGFPEDTKETLDETLQLLEELKLDMVNVANLIPFPGTKVFNQAARDHLFFDVVDLDALWNGTWIMDGNEGHFYIKPYQMSLDELNVYRKKFDAIRQKCLADQKERHQ
jgi:anaerobic magnesium-protoporphyrin IX monomethyl ester cyclase